MGGQVEIGVTEIYGDRYGEVHQAEDVGADALGEVGEHSLLIAVRYRRTLYRGGEHGHCRNPRQDCDASPRGHSDSCDIRLRHQKLTSR